MNSLTIVGRLTRDPEFTPEKEGKSQYTKYTVAVDNWKGDLTSFFDCISFGRQAEVDYKYLRKGRQVAVLGRHEQGEKYQDKHGVNRRSWSVRVERIEFLGTKAETASVNDAFPEPAKPTNDIPDSWEKAEEDCPF